MLIEKHRHSSLTLENLIESLLFVAEGPVSLAQIATALDTTPKQVKLALQELEETYQQRGLQLQHIRGRVQITTKPQSSSYIEKFLGLESQQKLTTAALETLAIVAYSQPVSRPQIDGIRGVNSDSVIKNLMFKGLIEETGRSDGPGRAILYSTTSSFLQHFGISSISDMPSIDENEQKPQTTTEQDQDDHIDSIEHKNNTINNLTNAS
ncbi:MAG TPA: SMC-Scp complex subunit ScpB [Chloroflexi bacterium]|nr:SMC-Scp complex subunit ScpB [Chloroflexota bacterium]